MDTTQQSKIKRKIRRKTRPLPDPNKSALFSAVLPGLGQAYNRRYWKIPLVYGAAIGMGLAIEHNHRLYIEVRRALFATIDGDPNTVVTDPRFIGRNDTNLRRNTDQFRNRRDQLIVYSAVLYALNIIEAHIDAHLQEFNINEDLAFEIQPKATGSIAGITLALKIK